MCGFCNVWACVCVGFVMCGCVCMCGCFGNMCTCIYCVLDCLYCVLVPFRLCIFILICFVCTSVRTAAPSENSIAISSNNNNNNNNNNKHEFISSLGVDLFSVYFMDAVNALVMP
jgi:hypothetical protein